MSRKKTLSGKKKIALMIGAAALVGGTAVVMTGTSNASAACDGFAQAVRNNENFIAGQRANPDAQSEARIANREAVIRQINLQQEAAGCAQGSGGGDQAAAPAQPPAGEGQAAGGAGAGGDAGATGEVVCAGQNLTFSNDGGAPAASSGQFPIGTQLKVTNLANNKTTTVEVTSTSGSCALLNAAAFEQVREAGKNVIRQVRIERLGAGAGGGEAAEPPAAEQPPADDAGDQAGDGGGGADQGGAAGEVVCAGSTVTLSGEGGAPAASSGQFPVGTQLKVTNLDNDKSTTVEVTSTSGSCALLNNAAFEQVREPGKFLIRNARIERVG
ncbi:hypothetical protein ABZ557_31015 [Streptomyces sp. NPDC019645]|uniref:hypothetical protein n=1 Tax=Streptomyces sp. NPDC019645 TaxID=3154786 RepID=UPI0033EDB597